MGRGGGVKGKITPEKLILFETSYLFFTMVNDNDTWIASQVDLKMSTVKPQHANWVTNIHNLIPQHPELIRSGFGKVGLLSDY